MVEGSLSVDKVNTPLDLGIVRCDLANQFKGATGILLI
ncbi:hypothetical protein X731_03765 [Mesorhizobium sp. L2C054A000]|nr:hypothetical protein X731_03765 [Mesorhizobium sp. L2C054A000]